MVYAVVDHTLTKDGGPVRFEATGNHGETLRQLYLIVHYTAGLTADGAISWFKDPRASASAHLVIGRDGSVTQLVRFDRIAWHAGRSAWGELTGLNKYSIGIELVNAGKLHKTDDGSWQNWASKTIPAHEVIVATHKNETSPAGWHNFPEAQIDAARGVALALNAAYQFDDILGHDDIAPRRKVDPGPAFPLGSFRSNVLGRRDEIA